MKKDLSNQLDGYHFVNLDINYWYSGIFTLKGCMVKIYSFKTVSKHYCYNTYVAKSV